MSRQRRHSMPFGAEPTADGKVRFRLWAPAARQVELALHGESSERRFLTLRPQTDGWFEIVTAEARPGSRYHYRIDGKAEVPDPASRSNPDDVHGPSEVIDPTAFEWEDLQWHGRPWHEAVIYELHVGTFTPGGNLRGSAKEARSPGRVGCDA